MKPANPKELPGKSTTSKDLVGKHHRWHFPVERVRHYRSLALAGDKEAIEWLVKAVLRGRPLRQPYHRQFRYKLVRKLEREEVYQQIKADKPALIERWRSEGKIVGKQAVNRYCAELAAEQLGISVRTAIREGRFGESKRKTRRK
jgi:hypothetical protein